MLIQAASCLKTPYGAVKHLTKIQSMDCKNSFKPGSSFQRIKFSISGLSRLQAHQCAQQKHKLWILLISLPKRQTINLVPDSKGMISDHIYFPFWDFSGCLFKNSIVQLQFPLWNQMIHLIYFPNNIDKEMILGLTLNRIWVIKRASM